MAEPGVGKSRLFFEFKATSQSDWMVLEAFSVSPESVGVPACPRFLHGYFRIAGEDDSRTRRVKWPGGLRSWNVRSRTRCRLNLLADSIATS